MSFAGKQVLNGPEPDYPNAGYPAQLWCLFLSFCSLPIVGCVNSSFIERKHKDIYLGPWYVY